ncbi:MAG TPA: GDSL-type esterase/lipase family protein [Phycisphaerae bacterium]|nr:GDSL-type esterase/lipase family protein [Phycisphaerae bacterium]
MRKMLPFALLTAAATITFAQTTPSTSTPASAPATNPYTKFAATAPAVPNPRDNQPFTNDTVNNLKPDLPTLFIAGDSTAATGNRTTRGWAALLVDYFDTSKVNLCNRAVGGQRFNTYTPTWNQILGAVKPGDFVVIQMGHNSGPLAGIGPETQPAARGGGGGEPVHTHGWYVQKYISDVRAKKATPIVMTLTLRDLWKDAKVERLKKLSNGDVEGMSDWSRQVAEKEKCLLIDHSNIIGDMYDKLGPEKVHPMFGDGYLHTNTAGAVINCEAFIAGLKALPDMPLVADLNDKGKAVPAYEPKK